MARIGRRRKRTKGRLQRAQFLGRSAINRILSENGGGLRRRRRAAKRRRAWMARSGLCFGGGNRVLFIGKTS